MNVNLNAGNVKEETQKVYLKRMTAKLARRAPLYGLEYRGSIVPPVHSIVRMFPTPAISGRGQIEGHNVSFCKYIK